MSASPIRTQGCGIHAPPYSPVSQFGEIQSVMTNVPVQTAALYRTLVS